MNLFVKNSPPENNKPTTTGVGFTVNTNRITKREETYLKIKGAFKIRVQNKGDVDIIIFGGFLLPAYSDETFETGDTNLSFIEDTLIQYIPIVPGENINLFLTTYVKK